MSEVLSCCQINSPVSVLLLTLCSCTRDPGHSIILETPISSVVEENVLNLSGTETAQKPRDCCLTPYCDFVFP